MNSLEPVLNPRSVAVVGASRDPTKRGYQIVQALRNGFRGEVYPVNPNGGELLGLPVATSVDALEQVPDLAFVSTPAESVPDVLEASARKGIRGAIVSAVGFRESGEAGELLERRVSEIARSSGIRVVGPNTSGILNTSAGLNLVGVRDVPPGSIALLSQSGNVALDIMNEASMRGCGISIYVGVGNETDVTFHEYVEYLEGHAPTAAILMYVEGFREGRRFIEVARRVTPSKPIVLLKGGRSDRGVAAARSHTGAMAGSYPVLRAALRQGGVSEVLRSDELLPVGIGLAGQPPMPAGTDVVVLSDGGGHGTLAADALASLSVPLAVLSPDTKQALRALLGRAANVENPIDVAGAADRDPGVFARAAEVIARDAQVGGLFIVGLFGGYAIRFSDTLRDTEETAATDLTRIMAEAHKPLVVHSLYAHTHSEPLRRLSGSGVPVVASLEAGSRCIRALHARGLFLHQQPVPPSHRRRNRRVEPASIVAARREQRATLMETEVRELLAEHDVTLAEAVVCRTAEAVTEAIERIGPPVVLKAVSPAIPHKTEAGGVALDIGSADEGRAAFARVLESTALYAVRRGLPPDVRSVLVMPMLPTPVAELLVGVRHDPQFGPVLTVGAGGVHVEILHDTALRGLPVGRTEALEMLDEIRIARLLQGYRGRPAADRDALAAIILGVAACALDHHEIDEIEANPVFAYPDRAVVVDARAFLKVIDSRSVGQSVGRSEDASEGSSAGFTADGRRPTADG